MAGLSSSTGNGYRSGLKQSDYEHTGSIKRLRPAPAGSWQTDESIHSGLNTPQTRPVASLVSPSLDGVFDIKMESPLLDSDEPRWSGFDTATPRGTDSLSLAENDDPMAPDGRASPTHGFEPRVPEVLESVQTARSILDEDENDPTSHAALSLRAEQILANAKKRLTVRSCLFPVRFRAKMSRLWKET